jgi:anti-sigma regulatory factor (Ser/Thr protein kinase)
MIHHIGADQAPATRPADAGLRADLPAQPRSVCQARTAVRRALAAWGMAELTCDAELLVSELVTNAVEHADGPSIGFALRPEADATGYAALICEVSDSSPVRPLPQAPADGAERGRGLAIVAALAATSGVRASPDGKTAWFTLALSGRAERIACSAQAAAEPRPAA